MTDNDMLNTELSQGVGKGLLSRSPDLVFRNARRSHMWALFRGLFSPTHLFWEEKNDLDFEDFLKNFLGWMATSCWHTYVKNFTDTQNLVKGLTQIGDGLLVIIILV